MAGGALLQPVVFPSIQRANPETLAVIRGAEQGKQRHLEHGNGFLGGTERACIEPSPEAAVYCFLRIINLLN